MNPKEKIAQLERLERQEGDRQRIAAGKSWLSVAAAAMVLAVMIVSGSRKVSSLRVDIEQLTERQKQLKRENLRLEDENKLEGQAIRQLDPVYDPNRELSPGLHAPRTLQMPKVAAIAPRIYLQILTDGDRDFARRMAQELRVAKYVVVGIENVPHAVKPLQTEVRYYKKDDTAEAQDIANVLKRAGASPVRTIYLQRYENSAAVRPKHYEVWFPPGVETSSPARSK